MKRILVTLVACTVSAAVQAGESDLKAVHARASYSADVLFKVRQRWMGQENRVGQLKFEAREYARKTPVQYICGEDHVADIDHTSQTITTHIPSHPDVVLSYAEFGLLLRDRELTEKAYGIEVSNR